MHGDRYFVTFIDDASRKTWVYMLKAKSQVFQKFQHFHAMVERETGMPLKALWTDNGREFTYDEFEECYRKHDICHERMEPGTPQHDGVAERMNKTIVKKVRSIFRMSKSSKTLWGEAFHIAVFIIKRAPLVHS